MGIRNIRSSNSDLILALKIFKIRYIQFLRASKPAKLIHKNTLLDLLCLHRRIRGVGIGYCWSRNFHEHAKNLDLGMSFRHSWRCWRPQHGSDVDSGHRYWVLYYRAKNCWPPVSSGPCGPVHCSCGPAHCSRGSPWGPYTVHAGPTYYLGGTHMGPRTI